MDKYPDLAINHKLYNVRVFVDAARSKQPRNMDAEVFSDLESGQSGGSSSGKNKKTVGISTNITIEVSDEEQENKSKSDGNTADEDTENASVPVFKGRPVDKNKNRPESKLYFDYSGSRETPIFPKTDDDSFRNLNWFHFQPPSVGYWTTAKPRTEGNEASVSKVELILTLNTSPLQDNFIPYGIISYPRPSPSPSPYPDYLKVQPCNCRFHDQGLRPPTEYLRPMPYQRSDEVYYSSRGAADHSSGVDDKLEYPFHA